MVTPIIRYRFGLLLLLVAGLFALGATIHSGFGAPDPVPELRQGQRPATLVKGVPGELATPVSVQTETSGVQYGINFISAAEDQVDEERYANALLSGATWNRWPFYWSGIEQQEGQFEWSAQDRTVISDLAHGLKINAILLGTPCFYQPGDPCPSSLETLAPERTAGRLNLTAPESNMPDGLFDSVFADGTDQPGPGKTINQDNRWARFVFAAVDRYRPGGVLSQQYEWPAGVGVTHWEIWNEPDLEYFWSGGIEGYARLVKVGYLAAHQADPQAQVLFGGLAFFEKPEFYRDVLNIYQADEMATSYGYYHDIIAIHNYFNVWLSWYYTWIVQQRLAAHGLQKPVWLNESGVAAWDDYPGPVWDPGSAWRSTLSEQADFVIQSAFFAAFAGADVIFHFQLYDGCGNQPAGTDFPPHDGSLCTAEGVLKDNPEFPCAGDAFGLFSNPTDAACFTQHPTPESPRPVFEAFQVLTNYVENVEPLWRLRPGDPNSINGPQEWIAFYRPETGERVLGLWARYGLTETASVPALAPSATLLRPDGTSSQLTANEGVYTLTLPGATNQNDAFDPNLYAIGGRPFILVEQDLAAPSAWIEAASFAWRDQLQVEWGGDDGLGGGVADYSVNVAVDGGAAEPWLTHTPDTSGSYPVSTGHTYTFTVIAYDRAGNPSQPANVVVKAVDPAGLQRIYLPVISRS